MRKDFPPLTDAQRDLFARYEQLATRTSWYWQNRCPWLADQLHDAVIDAVMEAAVKFPEGIPGSFRDYAGQNIRWQVAGVIRRNAWLIRKFGATVRVRDSDRMTGPSDDGKDTVDFILSNLLNLKDRDRLLFRLVFINGLNQTEAAAEIGLSKGRVTNIIKKQFRSLAQLESIRALAS